MADRGPPSLSGPLPSSFDDNQDFYNERPMQKVFRKIKEEPLIPIGMGLTTFAFVNAYRALRRGDSKQANRMFRARVLAQGFTVIAMVAGSMYYSQDREKSKELRKLKEEKDAEEKRQKWIRELEARDAEEKALRERVKQRVLRRQEGQESHGAADASSSPESGDVGEGGVLGKMGLWSKGEQLAKEAREKAEEAADEVSKSVKKENPKSSLRDLGELMGNKKNADKESKER